MDSCMNTFQFISTKLCHERHNFPKIKVKNEKNRFDTTFDVSRYNKTLEETYEWKTFFGIIRPSLRNSCETCMVVGRNAVEIELSPAIFQTGGGSTATPFPDVRIYATGRDARTREIRSCRYD